MAMMIDQIFKFVDLVNGPNMMMWCDNCGIHEANIIPLPPNLTWLLKVMDIFVNGSVKSHIRMIRAERLLIYFNVYKILFNEQLKFQ